MSRACSPASGTSHHRDWVRNPSASSTISTIAPAAWRSAAVGFSRRGLTPHETAFGDETFRSEEAFPGQRPAPGILDSVRNDQLGSVERVELSLRNRSQVDGDGVFQSRGWAQAPGRVNRPGSEASRYMVVGEDSLADQDGARAPEG